MQPRKYYLYPVCWTPNKLKKRFCRYQGDMVWMRGSVHAWRRRRRRTKSYKNKKPPPGRGNLNYLTCNDRLASAVCLTDSSNITSFPSIAKSTLSESASSNVIWPSMVFLLAGILWLDLDLSLINLGLWPHAFCVPLLSCSMVSTTCRRLCATCNSSAWLFRHKSETAITIT